jgi:glycosyltransferase involved in cell wall biosynthesis
MNRVSLQEKITEVLLTLPPSLDWQVRKFFGFSKHKRLYYVAPDADWVTRRIGRNITTEIQRQFQAPVSMISRPHLIRDQIVHYGELGLFLHHRNARHIRQNTVVTTVFHGDLASPYPELSSAIETFLQYSQLPTKIVTACSIMERRLKLWGIPSEKIVCIPLGIDLSLFKPTTLENRRIAREKYGIPDDAICIGSFQKDGVGWGEGLEPKFIKGPDIFIEVIHRLKDQHRIFILLSAPARGFVKKGLEKLNVPYKHLIFNDFHKMVELYHCLDLYLITSREEGGPEAVLESLATGVPVISTPVGLVPDVIQNGVNGLIAPIEDVEALTKKVSSIISDEDLRLQVIEKGLIDITNYDWKVIARRYFSELYRPLLGGYDFSSAQ